MYILPPVTVATRAASRAGAEVDDGVAVSPSWPALGYHPALDGLRALAVLAVMLYHADVRWMRGGYLGVDAFFVLSGFLITSLLLHEWRRTGRIALGAFFARRARRLLPALVLMIGGVAAYAAWFAPRRQLVAIRADAIAALAYVANWRQAASPAGYFDLFATPSPLRHTWSLAVEEQWYLLWPVAMVALLVLCGSRLNRMLTAIVVAALVSALWAAWLHDPAGDPSRVYYGTDTRAHELLVGAALAVLLFGLAERRAQRPSGDIPPMREWFLHGAAVVAAGSTLMLWMFAGADSRWLYEGGLLLAAVAVALVIASVLRERSPLRRALEVRPLVAIGLVSYGLYLWHWPVYLAMTPTRTGLDGAALVVVRFAVTAVLAVASFVLVERPIRKGALRGWRGRGALAGGAAIALAAMVVATWSAPTDPSHALVQGPTRVLDRSAGMAGSTAPRVFVAGDSVALVLTKALDRAIGDRVQLGNNTTLGCGLLPDGIVGDPRPPAYLTWCDEWRSQWPQDVKAFRPDVLVLFTGIWDSYSRSVDGQSIFFGSNEFAQWFMKELRRIIEGELSDVDRIVLLTNPCYRASDELGTYHGRAPIFDSKNLAWFNNLIANFALTSTRVQVVDLNRAACTLGPGILFDGVHFTDEGADRVIAAVKHEMFPSLR